MSENFSIAGAFGLCVCVCEQRCYEARSSNTIFSLASTQHFRHIGGFAFYVCCRRAHRMFYWTGLLILSVLIFRKMLNETCIAHSMTEHRFSKFHLNRFFVCYEPQPAIPAYSEDEKGERQKFILFTFFRNLVMIASYKMNEICHKRWKWAFHTSRFSGRFAEPKCSVVKRILPLLSKWGRWNIFLDFSFALLRSLIYFYRDTPHSHQHQQLSKTNKIGKSFAR